MNMNGVFDHSLDLGDIGEYDCEVEWSGYRPAVKAEDDYDEMEITKVVIKLNGSNLDVVNLLTDSATEALEDEAWSHFPTREDLAAEAATQLEIDHEPL